MWRSHPFITNVLSNISKYTVKLTDTSTETMGYIRYFCSAITAFRTDISEWSPYIPQEFCVGGNKTDFKRQCVLPSRQQCTFCCCCGYRGQLVYCCDVIVEFRAFCGLGLQQREILLLYTRKRGHNLSNTNSHRYQCFLWQKRMWQGGLKRVGAKMLIMEWMDDTMWNRRQI